MDHCRIWAGSQRTRVVENSRGRKLYRWRISKLGVKEKQHEFQVKMAENAEQFSELVESVLILA